MADLPSGSQGLAPRESSDLICDVERELVEQFLLLIRDNYGAADKATFFLEQRTGIVNVQGITNVRDVLSHLVTLLSPTTEPEKKAAQLANAEEHLRRAIIEPYEVAVNELLIKFNELYFRYKKDLLPIKDRHLTLQSARNAKAVDASFKEVAVLYASGRSGKGKNIWSAEWEAGVRSFIDAYGKLEELYSELEAHWNNYVQIRRDRKATLLAAWGIIATIVTFILGYLLITN